MTEREAFVCLNAVSGLGNMKIRRLIEAFGSGQSVWRQSGASLRRVEGIGKRIAENIAGFDWKTFLRQEMDQVHRHRITVLAFFEQAYPEYLRQTVDCPVVVYIRGNPAVLKNPGIALVGSRRASVYGTSAARLLAEQLARRHVTVISGMARGIDTAAHQGCLVAGGTTVAVLGSGLARIYPPENRTLAEKISASGCVISEFPLEVGPVAGNFPRRNRVISGLSAGIVVVEAAQRSGALITSRCALEQGREVFAVPGKIGQAQAAGTNWLIQQGAKLITCAEDVLEEFPDLRCVADAGGLAQDLISGDQRDLSPVEQRCLAHVSDEPIHLDDLLIHSGLKQSELMPFLLQWECEGRIKRLPGNFFILNL